MLVPLIAVLVLVAVIALAVPFLEKPGIGLRVGASFGVAGLGYLIAAAMTGVELDLINLIFLSLFAAILAAASVGVCALVGLLLRLNSFQVLWSKEKGSLLGLALGLFIYGLNSGVAPPPLAPNESVNNQQPGTVGLATYPGLLGCVFIVLHWPIARGSRRDTDPGA